MSELMNFEVSGQTDDSAGAVIIAGIPIASGVPSDGQVIAYSAAAKQWQYETLPISTVYQASGAASVTPVAASDIPMATDGVIQGVDIVRASPATFTLQPGTYRVQFSFQKATFGAAGATEQVTYQFYDATAAAGFGPIGEASGFAGATTVVCGVSIEAFVQLAVASVISVRALVVTGTTPALVFPSVTFSKLN